MKKIAILIIVVVGAIFLFFSFRTEEKAKIDYEVFKVRRGNIRNTITATGTIEPITQVEVGTQVSGTIARILVDYNSEVKKGQLIAELDKTVLESEYEAQQSTLYAIKTSLTIRKRITNECPVCMLKNW